MYKTIRKNRAFSIIEIIISISLFIFIASLGMGSYFRYYQASLTHNEIDQIETLLKQTRFKAQKNANSQKYGIYIDMADDSITSFKSVYDPDEPANVVLEIDGDIKTLAFDPNPGTTDTILFEAKTGITSNSGYFTIDYTGVAYKISINSQGVIELAEV